MKTIKMKKWFPLFLALLFAAVSEISGVSVSPVFAAGELPRLVDYADVLSDSEEKKLLDKLDEISERHQMDVAVVTVNSLDGASVVDYADDFYDDNGYGFGEGRDGILFLLSMGEREWNITTTGYAITVFTDAGLDYMAERIVGNLKKGDYAAAFTAFADQCDDYITQAAKGSPYDGGSLPRAPFPFLKFLAICFAIAFTFALLVTEVMKRQLKSVYSRTEADDYVKRGSMQLTQKSDLFLYRNVSRREIPKNTSSGGSGSSSGGSSTHTSSSGMTHGGRSGKF